MQLCRACKRCVDHRLTEVMRVLGWRRKVIRHNAQRVGRGFRRGLDTRTIFVMRCPVTKEIYHIGYDAGPSVAAG